jgi:hypothetical protein
MHAWRPKYMESRFYLILYASNATDMQNALPTFGHVPRSGFQKWVNLTQFISLLSRDPEYQTFRHFAENTTVGK